MRKLTKYALFTGAKLKTKDTGAVYEVNPSKQQARWRLRPLAGGDIIELRLAGINEKFIKA